MAISSLSHCVSAPVPLRNSSKTALLRCQLPTPLGFKKMHVSARCLSQLPLFAAVRGLSGYLRESGGFWSIPADGARYSSWCISCATHFAAGRSNDPEKVNMNHVIDKAKRLWDSTPQPVKSFPWSRALDNFIQLILDIILWVMKYLAVPVLAVSSLSEMSYCAHEKKLFLVPFPLLIGIAMASVLKETALELSPRLKDAEVPWHLIAIAMFFTLLKLPGPYYPYWGRIFIPHIANGALFRTLWLAFSWYWRPRNSSPDGTAYGSK